MHNTWHFARYSDLLDCRKKESGLSRVTPTMARQSGPPIHPDWLCFAIVATLATVLILTIVFIAPETGLADAQAKVWELTLDPPLRASGAPYRALLVASNEDAARKLANERLNWGVGTYSLVPCVKNFTDTLQITNQP